MRSLLYLFCAVQICFVRSFNEVTDQVISSDVRNGALAAFGDFTADKKVDLFMITDSGKTLKILVSHEELPFYHDVAFSCSLKLDSSTTITSVVPGDFNGDTFMDVMITIESQADSIVKVKILLGFKKELRCLNDEDYLKVKGQPLVLDYDGDAVVELMGEDENGVRSFWNYRNGTFNRIDFLGLKDLKPIKYPHSNSFIDLNGDLRSDIFVTTEEKFEFWIQKGKSYKLEKSIDPPPVSKYYQVTFMDIDADGTFEAIVPACLSSNCEESVIYALFKNEWVIVASEFIHDDKKWKFVLPDVDNKIKKSMLQPTLRFADLNMDGYPDCMAIMYSEVDGKLTSSVFIMINSAVNTNSVGRSFNISHSIKVENASNAAFHDVYENGRMDLLVTSSSSKNDFKLLAFKNDLFYDAYFLKVIVLLGECIEYCPRDKMSYGANVPGSNLRITTITSEAMKRYGYRAILPKSAYFSLDLPYVIFGIGQTPNFVEKLQIGLPNLNKIKAENEWNQIIPNSQVVIVPYPLNSPSSWYMKLFVTTSRLVLMTSGALIGTCLLIIIIISFLHWREKREDRKEKQQDAHRFHFNAM